MRYLFVILLFISIGAFAQKPNINSLEQAASELNNALINKDSATLKTVLSDELSYGHSNGWVQTKKEVIADLFNGKLTYKKTTRKLQNVYLDGTMASIRLADEVEVELNSKPLQLKLNVLQVWIWKNKHWVLFARQSVKI